MKYSIIIPVYNVENFLKKCIESIYHSGIKNFEIILINDGSTDASGEICKALCGLYSEIVYISQKNAGVSSARNEGIRRARGEYILFCDADDFYEPDSFQKIDGCLDSESDLFVFGISMDYYYKGICYRRDFLTYPDTGSQGIDIWSKKLKEMHQYNVLLAVWNKIYKRDVIEKNHLRFNEKMILLEDMVFTIQYLACCNKIYFHNDVVYRYRQAEQEHNVQKRLNSIPSIRLFTEEIKKSFKNTDAILHKRYGYHLNDVEDILYQIFYMLISQKIYYENIQKMKECREEIIKSDYGNEKKIKRIDKKVWNLYKNLVSEKYGYIKICNMYGRGRHYIAVRYKYCKCKIKGGIV